MNDVLKSPYMSICKDEVMKYKQYKHIATGFNGLDEQRGITTEDFVVIGGGTGSGKSLIALYSACFMAKRGETVVFINAEMSEKVLSDRIRELGFDYQKDFGTEVNHKHRLIILSLKDIKFEQITQLLQFYKPTVLFIDLFSSLLDSVDIQLRNQFTNKYAKELSFYPEKYNCAIIVTEQLVKDNRRVGRATIDDIAGGAALTRKATKVFTLYRYSKEKLESVANKTTKRYSVNEAIIINTTEIIVRKDRLGFWRDGINLIKYSPDKGFVSPDSYESSEYFSTVFGNQVGGSK